MPSPKSPIDRVQPPQHNLWYEDKDGKRLPPGPLHAPDEPPKGSVYQYFEDVIVKLSCCSVNNGRYESIWFLHWIEKAYQRFFRMMPSKWKRMTHPVSSESGVPKKSDAIMYLINKRGFGACDAIMIISKACERCWNILEWDAVGKKYDQHYLDTVHTSCDSCKVIDPIYYKKTNAIKKLAKDEDMTYGNAIREHEWREINSLPKPKRAAALLKWERLHGNVRRNNVATVTNVP